MNPGRWWNVAAMRLRSLFRRPQIESELDREVRFHLERQVEENLASGMTPDAARAAALRRFGGVVQVEEECRDTRRLGLLETISADVRYAARTMRKTPGFTAVMILTLGLSIGANSAIFSVIEGVLLRPLPYPRADRIVRIFFRNPTYPKFALNPFDMRDFRQRNRSFESLAAIARWEVQLSGVGEPVRLQAFRATAGYFRVLGFAPASGREFDERDELPGNGRVVILSDRMWRTKFASDPNTVGRHITLDLIPYTVIGVMPPGVQHPGNVYHALADGDTVDLWAPFTFEGNANNRGSHYLEGIARLKAGVTPPQANADLSAILEGLARENTGDKGWTVYLVPLYHEMVGRSQQLLLVLLGAVGLVLLIACVNAANLLLARATARRREMAVRGALGASRFRLVRQMLTESVLIALAGAAFGCLLAAGGVRALVALLPAGFPRASEIRLDGLVLAFTLAIAVVTGLTFGLVPALAASLIDLQKGLNAGGRSGTGGRGQSRLRSFLVVGETAIACVLLIGAGLMLHSFVNLLHSDAGFRAERVLTAGLTLPGEQYKDKKTTRQFYEALVTNLASAPGVQAAGIATDLPWTGYDENIGGFLVEGRPPDFGSRTTGRYHVASRDFFQTMGIPLVEGRFFTDHDDENAPSVLIVNRTMAQMYWPGESAVGKRISFDDHPKEKDWFRIVGVVGDVKDEPNQSAAHPAFWWPVSQLPWPVRQMSVAVRTGSDPPAAVAQVRQAVHGLNPSLAVAQVRWMSEIADGGVARERFALFLVGLFAVLALALAAIGVYGVTSYSVSQRMPEFGMRMALGARPGDLMRMILRQGVALAVAGSAAGLLCAVVLSRLLANLLYGVGGADPLTYAAVALLAPASAAAACYLPARRATGADPMRSLRAE
jgi:predicted permease